MLVKNWMTKGAITLTADRSMMKAAKILKDNNISRVPIVDDDGKLIGIVSDRDIKDASPSKATTLDMHELYYLLSEVKLKSIMTKKPVVLHEGDTVEKAAVLMLERNFGGLPVVDDENRPIGIITDTDVFKLLADITGVYHGGQQVCMQISNAPGSLAPVLEIFQNHDARIMSILSRNVDEDAPTKDIYIRIRDMEKPALKKLKAELSEKYSVQYWVADSVHPVVGS